MIVCESFSYLIGLKQTKAQLTSPNLAGKALCSYDNFDVSEMFRHAGGQ